MLGLNVETRKGINYFFPKGKDFGGKNRVKRGIFFKLIEKLFDGDFY